MLIHTVLKYGAPNMTVETCANLCYTYPQVSGLPIENLYTDN